jgi:hypothetical protein
MDKIVVFIVVIVILAGILFWGFQSGFFARIFSGPVEPVAIPEGLILFYGQGCPHCKIVDDFITQNKIEDKVKFIKLEVWYNKENQIILGEVAAKCGITSSQVGVPLLYDGKDKCYVGDVDIINFFTNEAGIK